MANDGSIQGITPAKALKQQWHIGTFDIETVPVPGSKESLLGDFNMAGCYLNLPDPDKAYTTFDTPLALLQHMLSFGDSVRWFAHNGGNFDFKYIFCDPACRQWLKENRYTYSIVGGTEACKAVIVRRKKKSIYFCDSFKLMQQSLDGLTKGFKVLNAKGFINFAGGEIFDKNNPLHMEYLRTDCIGLWQVLNAYRNIIQTEFQTEPKLTASSTAFRCWCRTLKPGSTIWHHNKFGNDFARKSYYGGRTECFYQGEIAGVTCIDVNSLYAHIMRECGGVHKPFYTNKIEYLDNGEYRAGFYRVRATVPIDRKFGYLPYRKPDGSGILFPVGTFETYASSVEIEFAIQQGCTVEVVEGCAYEEHDKDLFKGFIDRCIDIRNRDYNGALGLCAKFLQNNLYGFFGMKAERDEVIVSEFLPEDEGFDPLVDPSTGEVLSNLWVKRQQQETVNQVPAFAAWTTANARLLILKAAIEEEAAGNHVVYMDTDSLFIVGVPVSDIGKRYGQFKEEFANATFFGLSGKAYMYCIKEQVARGYSETLSDEEITKLRGRGKAYDIEGNLYQMKNKGVPSRCLTTDMFSNGLEGIATPAEMTLVNSFIRCLKTGERGKEGATRKTATCKSITNRVPGIDLGWTSPIKLNEFWI